MARKNHPVRLDGKEYKLRLTIAGQKHLRQQFNKPPIDVAMEAASDEEMLCALLTEALSWPESGNEITDGEEFYDLLVDNGYDGQDQFFGLVMDIASKSGMMKPEVAKRAKDATEKMLNKAFASAFDAMEGALEEQEPATDTDEENPTKTKPND